MSDTRPIYRCVCDTRDGELGCPAHETGIYALVDGHRTADCPTCQKRICRNAGS